MLPYIEMFGRQISMYAVCIMAGLAFGIIIAWIRAKKVSYNAEDVLFASFYGILGLIAGGKLLYLITIFPYLREHITEIIHNMELVQALLSGGFVFYGGFLGALAGIWIYGKQYHLKIGELVELMIPSVPLVHAFGRIGCFCAGCCYGKEFPEPFGIAFQHSLIAPNNVPLFPVQLVEAAGNFILFFLLLIYDKRKKRQGQVTGLYLAGYSVMRFFLEYFRADTARGIWLGLSTSQWISIGILIAGIVLLRGKKSRE